MYLSDTIKGLQTDENGQGLLEYGLIILLIAVAVIIVLSPVGKAIESIFNFVNSLAPIM